MQIVRKGQYMVVEGSSKADRGALVGVADTLEGAETIALKSKAHKRTLRILIAGTDRTPRGAELAAD